MFLVVIVRKSDGGLMIFKTQSELENYLLQKMQNAIIKTQERVYQIIGRFVREYYTEFTPEVYERTYQLYRSLVMSKIEPTEKGYKCYIYFDLNKLDYQMKSFTRNPVNNGYMNPFTHKVSSDGSFPNPKGSAEKTLYSAAHGSHGGYRVGTAIFDDPLKIINVEAINTLKDMLRAEGIPVK